MEKSFEAFQGNPLQKSSTNKTSKRQLRSSSIRIDNNDPMSQILGTKERLFDIDQMWRGSISNLKSSENITDDLIKESIQELEKAMSESKKMLQERDAEIARLRQFIENNKLGGGGGRDSQQDDDEREKEEEVRHAELLKQLQETQKRNSTLEKQIHKLELDHSREIHDLKMQQNHQTPAIWHLDTPDSRPECTCYCGTVCKALRDLVDAREQLEITKTKYEGLKKRVREFRKQAEVQQNMRYPLRDDDRLSSCSIQ